MIRRALLFGALAAVLASAAGAQDWPARPLRVIVAGAAGSSLDIPVRAVAERLKDTLGQPLVVDNRPAAGGTVAADAVAKSVPDGYTLLMAFNGPLAYAPFLYARLPYDPQKDLVPVIQMGGQPSALTVPATLGVATLRELLELARRQPGKLNYSSLGNGSSSHISMELLKREAGIDLVHVPYAGGVAAATAVAAGEVQAYFAPVATVIPHLRAGRVRVIAVSSARRFAPMADVPTVAEQGFPGFDSYGWNGILAPAGTPRAVIDRLNHDAHAVLNDPAMKAQLAPQGVVLKPSTPEEFGAFLRAEVATWAKVVQDSGARVE